MTLNRLTAEQVATFKIDGFLVVEDLLGMEEVERLQRHSDLIAAGKADHIPEDSTWFEEGHEAAADFDWERERVLSIFKLFNLAVRDAVMWRHVTNVKIVEVIRDLLATDDVKMYGDQQFMKPPGDLRNSQLLLDDRLIDDHVRVQRVWHQPQKYGRSWESANSAVTRPTTS